MLIERVINGVNIQVDINKSNAIYFEESFSKKIYSNDIGDILNTIYEERMEILPLTALFEITNNCNFNCPFCYIHNESIKIEKSLDYEKIENVLSSMIKKGLLFCTLTGGECLINPHFSKIYKYLKQNGVLVTVLTNGSLINDEYLSIFKEYKPYKIEISLYGYNQVDFEKNTKQKKYKSDDIKNTILKLRNNDINVICKTPLNSITEQSFYDINDWCNENNIPYYYSPELYDTYDGRSSNKFKIKNKYLIDLIKKSDFELYNKIKKECGQKKYFDCKAGKFDLIITYDWKLLPCFSFRNIEEAMFDINDDFDYAYENMKSYILKYKNKPIEYCKGCIYYNMCKECAATAFSINNCNNCQNSQNKINKILEENNE